MKEGIDYIVVEKPSSDFYSIKILTGEYAGVIYTYGAVSFDEECDDEDAPTLSFDFKVESGLTDVVLETDETFCTLIGDVLVDIIEQNLCALKDVDKKYATKP